ncbi:hypothetical protein HPB47_012315, partial [Ixodes persulcatus]
KEDSSVYREFCRTISKPDERYDVSLPWRPKAGKLETGRTLRLEELKRRLLRKEPLTKEYNQAIHHYITASHAEVST